MKKTNMMTKMTTIGIDYSLTCPAVCVYNGSFENSKFYYVATKRKYEGVFLGNITGHSYKDYNDDIERYKNLSDMVLHIIEANQTQIKVIFLEGYSFGSKGRAIFNIAENGGILKYRLKKWYLYCLNNIHVFLYLSRIFKNSFQRFVRLFPKHVINRGM